MPYQPRRSVGAYSALSSTEPAHSPPTANPCSNRSTVRSRGAAMPIDAVLGTRPTLTVEAPMMSRVATRVFLRPSRSPK